MINGGTEVLAAGATAEGTIALGTAGELAISGTVMPDATIVGFMPASGGLAGVTIDLAAIAFDSNGTAALGADNVLNVSEGGQIYSLHLDPAQSFAGEYFTLGSGLSFGSETTIQVACFAGGTRLLTDRGEVAVEQLAVGDLLRTPARGEHAPIRWIGQRAIDARRHPRPEDVRPIGVRADAFGLGRPHRDLLLSPDHAIFAEGVLIPVRHLLNGTTVLPAEFFAVRYFHVELARHDIVLAEGLPTETYLDLGNRSVFANGGGAPVLHPVFSGDIRARGGCAELILGGPVLARVRAQLQTQAALLGAAARTYRRSSI